MIRTFSLPVTLCTLVACLVHVAHAAEPKIVVTPAEVSLSGSFAQAQLLVAGIAADGTSTKHSADLTSQAKYATSDDVPTAMSTGTAARISPPTQLRRRPKISHSSERNSRPTAPVARWSGLSR